MNEWVSEWVSEWVEFNAPLDTIQVISEAESEWVSEWVNIMTLIKQTDSWFFTVSTVVGVLMFMATA